MKIDPKSIGVGQYQHDVNQAQLGKALDGVVESCVNAVGVDVNTASAKLLAYVSGIGPTLAKNIVEHRAANGPFRSRRDLKKVPRLGPKAFEQAAGFLRVRGGGQPARRQRRPPRELRRGRAHGRGPGRAGGARWWATPSWSGSIDIRSYVDERRGEPTLRDIVGELEKPGRDPRQSFEETGFREDVTEIEHLQEGMVLDGVVTNVTAFGAFVDVGVHQDGLVHVSELAHQFVKDPAEVVKVGDRVKVRVLKVEKDRKRIALSIKQASAPPAGGPGPAGQKPPGPSRPDRHTPPRPRRRPRSTASGSSAEIDKSVLAVLVTLMLACSEGPTVGRWLPPCKDSRYSPPLTDSPSAIR